MEQVACGQCRHWRKIQHPNKNFGYCGFVLPFWARSAVPLIHSGLDKGLCETFSPVAVVVEGALPEPTRELSQSDEAHQKSDERSVEWKQPELLVAKMRQSAPSTRVSYRRRSAEALIHRILGSKKALIAFSIIGLVIVLAAIVVP